MKHSSIRDLILLALFADVGFVAKRLIAPAANIVTDFLRVPGGIGTSFSLMFLVVGAWIIQHRHAGAVMGLIQSLVALALGMVGAMGVLSPIGYVVPGIVIDLVLEVCRKSKLDMMSTMVLANAAGAVSASLAANLIVFRLHGTVLLLYLLIGIVSGGICGLFAGSLTKRLKPLYTESTHEKAGEYAAERKQRYAE